MVGDGENHLGGGCSRCLVMNCEHCLSDLLHLVLLAVLAMGMLFFATCGKILFM